MAMLGTMPPLQTNIVVNIGTTAFDSAVITIPPPLSLLGLAQSQIVEYMSTTPLLGQDNMTQIVIPTTKGYNS